PSFSETSLIAGLRKHVGRDPPFRQSLIRAHRRPLACRTARYYRTRGDILRYDAARADDGSLANDYARHYERTRANKAFRFNGHWRGHQGQRRVREIMCAGAKIGLLGDYRTAAYDNLIEAVEVRPITDTGSI